MSMKIRRINLYGGPGSGKSRTAGWLFGTLGVTDGPKMEMDFVQESCKQWVYIDRPPTGWSDQNKIFSDQLALEETALRKVDLIVCDAPLLMNCFYGWKFDRPGYKHNIALAEHFEAEHPSLNIFLRRKNIKYCEVGRFQNEEQATAMDVEVTTFVNQHLTKQSKTMVAIDTVDRAGILKYIIDELKG